VEVTTVSRAVVEGSGWQVVDCSGWQVSDWKHKVFVVCVRKVLVAEDENKQSFRMQGG
jgi:hypothetical protein